jgi:hypothetical protein
MTMTVAVAQATDPGTPDLSESEDPTPTTLTETVTESMRVVVIGMHM